MKLHRFIGNFTFTKDELVLNDKELFNQLKNVLRIATGEHIVLSDGAKKEARVRVSGYGDGTVTVAVEERYVNDAESSVTATLYMAVVKRDSFEHAAQKATEAGIARIVPMITDRTVKLNIALPRMRAIVKEAAEQSGRGVVPIVEETMSFEEALHDAKGNDANVFFDPSGSAFATPDGRRIGIFVGPEGGFDPSETEQAREAGISIAHLGRRILRAETAATIATYLTCQPKGE
jgi:16S rRNA (uracil1498-N3)-methyltransferase